MERDDSREQRKLYVIALRLVGKGDYSSLVKFMKTK
jgi:hypothetical protein